MLVKSAVNLLVAFCPDPQPRMMAMKPERTTRAARTRAPALISVIVKSLFCAGMFLPLQSIPVSDRA